MERLEAIKAVRITFQDPGHGDELLKWLALIELQLEHPSNWGSAADDIKAMMFSKLTGMLEVELAIQQRETQTSKRIVSVLGKHFIHEYFYAKEYMERISNYDGLISRVYARLVIDKYDILFGGSTLVSRLQGL